MGIATFGPALRVQAAAAHAVAGAVELHQSDDPERDEFCAFYDQLTQKKVEVEVESMDQVQEALEAGAHIIMLDNMSVAEMAEAMKVIGDRAIVEASGGITYDTVRAVAETGVDLISIGGLTHSVDALDISLDLEFD